MADPQDKSPQVSIAKGVIHLEPDTQAVDTYMDALESRLERAGRAFKEAMAPPEVTETGPATQHEGGVSSTPVQFTNTKDQEITRIAESVSRCEQYLAVIASLLAERGT